MRIALAASEMVPFSKTGGLADVTGALFKEFSGMGHETCAFVPLYKTTWERFKDTLSVAHVEFDVPLGGSVRRCKVFTSDDPSFKRDGGKIFFISNDAFFGRDELYGTSQGNYPDNDQRFAFFCRSILETCKRAGLQPDVVHCNDWQTGLIPLYLKRLYRGDTFFARTASILTIHNLGYQGLFPPPSVEVTGLGWDLFHPGGVEFFGKMNFLKAGIIGADAITTVSTTYAHEILTPEYGFGLEGVLRGRADSLYGILNGIDYDTWNPKTDTYLPKQYGEKPLRDKRLCKQALLQECGLKGTTETPLISFIGRLSSQKGIDILSEALPELLSLDANVIIIGKGDEAYHTLLRSFEKDNQGRFSLVLGFNDPLAHRVYAGSDIFLMPSRYEPCGLGQLIAMRYGTITVGRRTGGLSDTIEDIGAHCEKAFCEKLFGEITETGLLFDDYSSGALLTAVKKALCVYFNKGSWNRLVMNALAKDFSWRSSALQYIELYKQAQTRKGA